MIVGVDYGRKWCGLATSDGVLAEPHAVVSAKNILAGIETLAPERVVVGISEGRMAREVRSFARRLTKMLSCPVYLTDETLTSVEAEKIKRGRVKKDAVAAALILQRYIDSAQSKNSR
jgi:RNase H-fold protein (predicted Holliday junction resolvase)